MRENGVIVYLTQDTDVNKTYLKTSLYFLFKYFNGKFKYPVKIFHTADYSDKSKVDIIKGVRGEYSKLVEFVQIHADDFTVPRSIDMERLNASIQSPPVAWWRTCGYRLMCRFYSMLVHKYLTKYEYYMRLDDDSFIEEDIAVDLFRYMKHKEYTYAYNMINIDCNVCTSGMHKNVTDYIATRKITPKNNVNDYWIFHNGHASPRIFFNNYHISRVDFWSSADVKDFLDHIDSTGNIFYSRWGDAPIQTMALALFCPRDKLWCTDFAYSKKYYREAVILNDTYIPPGYGNYDNRNKTWKYAQEKYNDEMSV